MIEDFVDQIYIINLDERKDRWEHIQNEMDKLGIENYIRFPAIKPELKHIPEEYYNKYTLIGKNRNKYIQACTGSKMSQTEVMKIAQHEHYNKILIIQDDAMFIDNAVELFNKAIEQLNSREWDILYLGGNHVTKPERMSENLVKLTGSYSSIAYIIKPSVWNYYIAHALRSGKEMDVFAKQDIHPHYRCFCLYPSIVWDKPGYSNVLQGYRDYKNAFNRKFEW